MSMSVNFHEGSFPQAPLTVRGSKYKDCPSENESRGYVTITDSEHNYVCIHCDSLQSMVNLGQAIITEGLRLMLGDPPAKKACECDVAYEDSLRDEFAHYAEKAFAHCCR